MPDEGYLAMGIDSKNKPIRSIASDPGHCLLNGIVDDSLKKAVPKRVMKEDMFSGWGVRTLSSEHPAFNPFSYHCGSVWPVENAMFVLALAHCGLYDEMNRLAKVSSNPAPCLNIADSRKSSPGSNATMRTPSPGFTRKRTHLKPGPHPPPSRSCKRCLAFNQMLN